MPGHGLKGFEQQREVLFRPEHANSSHYEGLRFRAGTRVEDLSVEPVVAGEDLPQRNRVVLAKMASQRFTVHDDGCRAANGDQIEQAVPAWDQARVTAKIGDYNHPANAPGRRNAEYVHAVVKR